ncbi:MAG: hypothetical protein JNM21_08305 [Taibaiella sp.]|nr:hypothetical protein [Taibaiella sp.]
MKRIIFILSLLCYSYYGNGQEPYPGETTETADEPGLNRRYYPLNFYPIGDELSIGYLGNLKTARESYLFEAQPTVKLPFFNTIYKNMKEPKAAADVPFGEKLKKATHAAYASFQPQLRMFNDASMPVKTPSYKIGIGYQHLFSLNKANEFGDLDSRNLKYIAIAFETGHFSNGQSGAAFDEHLIDGTPAADSLYQHIDDNTDLAAILNRKSGNFSTNYTEIMFKYLQVFEVKNDYALHWFSAEAGWTRYHDNLLYMIPIGGYTENDIVLYGKNLFHLNFEYMYRFRKPGCIDRVKLNVNYEYLYKPHASVTRSRIEIIPAIYHKSNVGIYAKLAFGHDTYNYRFVDNISHWGIGLTYDLFPSLEFAR